MTSPQAQTVFDIDKSIFSEDREKRLQLQSGSQWRQFYLPRRCEAASRDSWKGVVQALSGEGTRDAAHSTIHSTVLLTTDRSQNNHLKVNCIRVEKLLPRAAVTSYTSNPNP